jgi:hypothetical protein
MNSKANIDKLVGCIVSGSSGSNLEADCNGLDLDDVGTGGRTPLMVASAERLLSAVATLVRLGASIRAVEPMLERLCTKRLRTGR